MSKKLFGFFRQSEADCLKASIFGQIVDEYLDSCYFEGYAEQLREENPEEYNRQYLLIVEQNGGTAEGGVMAN